MQTRGGLCRKLAVLYSERVVLTLFACGMLVGCVFLWLLYHENGDTWDASSAYRVCAILWRDRDYPCSVSVDCTCARFNYTLTGDDCLTAKTDARIWLDLARCRPDTNDKARRDSTDGIATFGAVVFTLATFACLLCARGAYRCDRCLASGEPSTYTKVDV